jgi:hypothetical protein
MMHHLRRLVLGVAHRALLLRSAALAAWTKHVARDPLLKKRSLPQRRPPAPDRHGLAVVAILKNEAEYVEEWLAFHLMVGARSIIIYDNGSTDGTLEILARFAQQGVTVVPWSNFTTLHSTQDLAYAHALANFGHAFRWMAFIDVDEFLFPREEGSLNTVLDMLAHLPSISIPWRNFGPGGHETKPAGLVIESYTECAHFPPTSEQRALVRYKSIVDPAAVAATGSHAFPLHGHGDVMVNEDGRMIPVHQSRDLSFAVSRHLQLNHYFTRSLAEFRAREAKGRVSKNGAVVRAYADRRFAQYGFATEQDTAILRFAPALKERLAAQAQAREYLLSHDL